MTATHDQRIRIPLDLGPAPPTRAGFRHAIICDGVTFGSSGDTWRLYTAGGTALATDLTAGDITSAASAAVTAAFVSGEAQVALVKADISAPQTYIQARNAAEADGLEAVFWNIDSRDMAVIAAFAVDNEARLRSFFMAQTSDADIITSGLPAAWSALAGFQKFGYVYHPTNAQWYDVALTAACAKANPDSRSAPWRRRLIGVAEYPSPGITDAQKDFALANYASLLLPFTNQTRTFSAEGLNLEGRPIEDIVTKFWFFTRVQEDLASTIISLADADLKFPVDETGQNIIKGILSDRFDQGVSAGHFRAGQLRFEPYEITDADRSAGLITSFKAVGQLLVSGREFEVPVLLTTDEVVLIED